MSAVPSPTATKAPARSASRAPASGRTRWLGRVLLLLVSSALALVGLEAGLRFYEQRVGFEQPALLQLNPSGGGSYRLKPGVVIDRVSPCDGARIHIATNSAGMRWREVSPSKPVGVWRVAFVGDSFTLVVS